MTTLGVRRRRLLWPTLGLSSSVRRLKEVSRLLAQKETCKDGEAPPIRNRVLSPQDVIRMVERCLNLLSLDKNGPAVALTGQSLAPDAGLALL